MNPGLVLQAVVAGLAAGAVYGLVGLGYGLIFRLSRVLNFAHGDMVTVAVFALLVVLGGGTVVPAGGVAPWAIAVGAVAALGVGAAVGAAIQRGLVAPLGAGGSTLGWIGATVAAGLLLRSLVGLRFSADSYTVPEVLPVGLLAGGGLVRLPGGGVLHVRDLVVFAVALLAAIAFDRWLEGSRSGRAMRASAEHPGAAQLCGIDPRRLQLLGWAIAGLLAAAAGVLLAPARPLTIDLGIVLALKGTAAAVIGRLGSARGTIVAGLALGVLEALVTTLSLPAITLAGVRMPALGPFPGLEDVGVLLVLLVVLVAWPGSVGAAGEAPD